MIRLGIGSGLIMGGQRIFEGGIEGYFGVGMGGRWSAPALYK
jgi:hypothetical protein